MAATHGTLENEIMNAVWAIEEGTDEFAPSEISVSDILEYINKTGAKRAYTTVKTVMDRLVEKELLVRTKSGKKFYYNSTSTRRESANAAIKLLADQYFNNDIKLLMKAIEKECLA